jgi:hypothetical protein
MLSRYWPLCERVLVNLINGDAIAGVLIDRKGPLLVLAHAALISEDGTQPSHMDGQVYVERDQVLFIQALPPKG